MNMASVWLDLGFWGRPWLLPSGDPGNISLRISPYRSLGQDHDASGFKLQVLKVITSNTNRQTANSFNQWARDAVTGLMVG